jgi:hypothetical protein
MFSRKVAVFLLILMLGHGGAPLRADDADLATDIAQMKKVWEALMAYQEARGQLPDNLSDLVPEFLPDPKVLLSPRDAGAQQNGPLTVKDAKHPSSYGYEWGPQRFRQLTFKEVKACQVEEYGPIVPLLRCFLYPKALNISHAGDFYETETDWEIAPPVKDYLAKHGPGPGCKDGRFVEVTTTDAAGQPVNGVRVTASNRRVQGLPLPNRRVMTGPDGKVRVPFGPDPISNGILAFSGGGHFAFPQNGGQGGFPEKLAVTVQPGRRGGGVVRNAAGRPVAGARIWIFRVDRNLPARAPVVDFGWRGFEQYDPDRIALLETDAGGRWEVDAIPQLEKAEVIFHVSHPDYCLTRPTLGGKELPAEALFASQSELVLRDPLRVRGQFHDRNGAPIARAPVTLFSGYDVLAPVPPGSASDAETDADGRFELRTRVPGEAHFIAVPKDFPPLLEKIIVEDEAGPLAVTPAVGRKLAGRVVDIKGKPVAGVPILFGGWKSFPVRQQPVIATTDADGRWVWEQAAPGILQGQALLPSGRLWGWQEEPGREVEVKVPVTERE